jgi:hypothetical protein
MKQIKGSILGMKYLNLSQEVMMKALEIRGITFKHRRMHRGLSVKKVADLLKLPERNIIAFELGVELQLPREALHKIGSLNTRWTFEDMETFRMRRVG